MDFLVSCGDPVGDEDVAYGPARSFAPSEVAIIAAFLETQDEEKLRSSVNWSAMHEAEIYGSAGDENPVTDEEWEYFLGAFRNAREFMTETATRKMAVLLYLN